MRMCVGCRARSAKRDLLRVVARGGRCIPDPQAVLPGRGAYVHPAEGCVREATRRRAWGRALRTSVGDSSLVDGALAAAAARQRGADRGETPGDE